MIVTKPSGGDNCYFKLLLLFKVITEWLLSFKLLLFKLRLLFQSFQMVIQMYCDFKLLTETKWKYISQWTE